MVFRTCRKARAVIRGRNVRVRLSARGGMSYSGWWLGAGLSNRSTDLTALNWSYHPGVLALETLGVLGGTGTVTCQSCG